MKKIYTLLLLIVASASFAQTFYSENFGTPTATTLFADYTAFQNSTVDYSGTGDVRTSSPSTGYTGASGSGNAFLGTVATVGKYMQIDGLNTSAYASADLILSFGYSVTPTASQLILEQSTNGGTTWTPITFTNNSTTSWALVTIGQGQIASSATLSLKFTNPGGTAQVRIDDIKLSNLSAACTLNLGIETTACDAVTSNLDTYTATIPFTGAGNATYGITTTSGTIGGDNPSTTAEGNIVITGITEGTAITVTAIGGSCSFTRDINAPECKPVNTLPYYDSFDYTVGTSLNASQKWTSANSGDNVTVASGNLSYTNVTPAGNSVAFSGTGAESFSKFTPTTTGAIYASFLLKVTDYVNVTADGTQTAFAVLTSELSNGYLARVYIKKSGSQYLLGATSTSTSPPADAIYSSTAYNVGDVVLVVFGYDFAANQLKLWLNPSVATFSATTPATITETPTNPLETIAGFILRQENADSTPSITIDELKIRTEATLGINNNNTISGLKVYPNPVTKGTLYIETATNGEKAVAIFDVLGKQVINTTTSSDSVNVAGLTAGVYIVKITEEGNTATKKLIIQ